MKEHTVNSLNNFIAGWYMEDTSICDEIINFHKSNSYVTQGVVGGVVNIEQKDSRDTQLDYDQHLYSKYQTHLIDILNLYSKKFEPFVQDCDYFKVLEQINVQHYQPGGGFKRWHTERDCARLPMVARHLVFMTYLNDVTDGGETEFYYQKIKIKAEKGLTLMWGVDWTFTHRGIVSPTQDKYITTGWLGFY
jgi:hypothetical protein